MTSSCASKSSPSNAEQQSGISKLIEITLAESLKFDGDGSRPNSSQEEDPIACIDEQPLYSRSITMISAIREFFQAFPGV